MVEFIAILAIIGFIVLFVYLVSNQNNRKTRSNSLAEEIRTKAALNQEYVNKITSSFDGDIKLIYCDMALSQIEDLEKYNADGYINVDFTDIKNSLLKLQSYINENKDSSFDPKTNKFYESNLKELEDYKACGIKQYRISGACDTKTCQKCALMDGKVFDVAEAIIGINAPPFEETCRCTTTAIIEGADDSSSLRSVRDENGKSIQVPYITYKEWSKKYAPEKYQEYFN